MTCCQVRPADAAAWRWLAGGYASVPAATGSSSRDVEAIRLRVLVPTLACRKVIMAG